MIDLLGNRRSAGLLRIFGCVQSGNSAVILYVLQGIFAKHAVKVRDMSELSSKTEGN